MSHRRVGAAGQQSRMAAEKNSLHRCAVTLCANPAVSEGVCAMHLSRPGRSTAPPSNTALATGYASPGFGHPHHHGAASSMSPDGQHGTPDRFYRSGAHMAMQPRAGPASKKQRTTTNAPGAGLEPPGNHYSHYPSGGMALTQDSLDQMNQTNQLRFPKAPGGRIGLAASPYDDNAYLSHTMRPSGSTNDSVHSESENSMDADKETNQRRERNRIAARKSRQRKLDRISNLEDEKMRLEQHRDMLVQEIRSLEKRDAASGGASGAASTSVVSIPDKEYAHLQDVRIRIIKAVEDAYNNGNIASTLSFLRDDSIVSGPQNSSVHLRGRDALVLDYLCTTYLFSDIHLHHAKIDSGGPRSQHFRVHWIFTGRVKSAGVSMNKEFLELIESVKGKRVTIEGVSNFSFSGDKIVYVHRTADQAKFLSALVNLSKE
uniref:BZIP domain-containing protein n=1 Tax=Globisporangium ultimum (strain ATCC 200006 / CBS 805.95 / DAOM BR144) TaxID=431595 RepID=K3WRV9_GLOUD